MLGLSQGPGLIKVRVYLLMSGPVFFPLTQDVLLLLETGAEAGDCHPESIPLSSLATVPQVYPRQYCAQAEEKFPVSLAASDL